jgi:hypothetical protein
MDPSFPNGTIKLARLTISCPAKEVNFSDERRDGDRELYFDDNPGPFGIGKMWLLKVIAEEPYNAGYSVGLGVIKAQATCNTKEKLYRRIRMYQSGAEEGTNYGTLDWAKHEFTPI